MAAKKKIAPVVAQDDPRAPLDGAAFLSAAQRVVATLRDDLLKRADESPGVAAALRAQWDAETVAKRTGDSWEVWRRRVVIQIGVAWVLSLVFARVLEDRGLLERNRVAGPGATDSQEQFRGLAPYLTDRDYLLTVFRELSNLPAAKDLFDPAHNPVWKLGPSIDGARALLDLFRAPSAETPAFRFGQSDTRFLGDLYQSLDEETRERFALLQTPHFVESYILDRTLERAIARFGLDETTLIDPTCGSGHFLLGAFERLVEHRLRKEPGLDVREAARRALDAVYGADINPYAVSIARFRLTLAFVDRGGYGHLATAPALPLHLVVGDSLLHAPLQAHLGDIVGTSKQAWAGKEFALEDENAAKAVLHRRYAAVVGNPPYITVKDPVLRERYREMYPRSAAGKYSLGAPFTERFFLLARPSGFVGMITANSFMKREFGKKLIEDFLPTTNLDSVVNTAGAYIPAHDTPTVLLFGTNEPPIRNDVLTVLAKRGEPTRPDNPDHGLVWRSIADHSLELGFENDYVSVARIPRTTLAKHPWSLGGGGATSLKELLEERAAFRLSELVVATGVMALTGEDDVYVFDSQSQAVRNGLAYTDVTPFGIGENIRDWSANYLTAIYPHDASGAWRAIPGAEKHLWRFRQLLQSGVFFGKKKSERGMNWRQYAAVQKDKLHDVRAIAYAEVATHNHFVFDRGGKIFKQTAPVVKLDKGAADHDYLALLAYLNSSTACFWMKQVCFPKATSNKDVGDIRGREESNRYAFSATALQPMPVPDFGRERSHLAALAAQSLELAELRQRCEPADVVRRAIVSQAGSVWSLLEESRIQEESLRLRLVALQEEIDWIVYALVGLIGRAQASDRCKREEATGASPELKMLESPVYKRQWQGRRGIFGHTVETFEEATVRACVTVVLESVERVLSGASTPQSERDLWGDASVAAAVSRLGDVVERLGGPVRALIRAATSADAVPFLSALRHTDGGLEKRAQWEHVWSLQRAEDRGDEVPPFTAAPKYDQKDYRDATCWRLRGKLDIPKERFISYPGCESDEDGEPVYGWAGWNHLQQAIALATLYLKRKQGEAWGKDRLVPMLAGLDEVLPWVWQWHPDATPESGGMKPGQYIADFLNAQCQELGVTLDEIRAWRPGSLKKGGRAVRGASPDDAELVRPSLTAQEESLLIILALANLRPSNRVALARAFALLHQPATLKKLVPSHLRDRTSQWARAVKGRSAPVGMFRTALEHWLADGKLIDQAGTIRVRDGAQLEGLQRWWAIEAELAFAAADALTEETLEKLVSKVPTVDRAELRETA